MTVIVNPFAGCQVLWTWAQHIAGGYEGGTDYRMRPPQKITAAADGVVSLVSGQNGFTPGPAIYLKLADGRSINYREVASPLVASGATVKLGQPIGLPNSSGRVPHIDAIVGGIRVEFEPLVNSLITASGTVAPLDTTQPRRNTMTTLYVKQSTGDHEGGVGSLWALAGDAGAPCPGNWQEFTRTKADFQTNNDKASRLATVHGSGVFLTDAEWAAFEAAYTTAAPAGTFAIDPKAFQPVIDAAVTALAAKIPTKADIQLS